MVPQLRRLGEQFHDDVVSIGVHSPKFTAEREVANVRAAALALEIDHPVVNDPDHLVWDQYAVRAWPTLIFIDPLGRVIGKHEGELHMPALGELVGKMLAQFRADGALARDAAALPLRLAERPTGPLAFPDKVLADEARGRLIVADTGHHRVIVSALDAPGAANTRIIGTGRPGFDDGAEAGFHAPRGLAVDGDTLYVADSVNHAIRRVDLSTGEVGTIAGTGTQAERFHRGGRAREVALSSPWDLAFSADRRVLYIAMAGFHQVWALDLAGGEIGPYSGTGHEGIKDDRRSRAWHAQPYGLWFERGTLFVADSETSAVRAIDTTEPDGAVRTLVGSGLFDFGDADRPGSRALVQHTAAVCVTDGAVWVADAYNNKVRKIDLSTGWVSTVAGRGEHGMQDGVGEAARFWEPSGLSVAAGKLYIADTNNHAIRVLDLASEEVTTLVI